VGCILLAGGQGSRLGVQGPKGMFSIGGKSLFQWICERAPTQNFPIAVMTSPLNHEETVDFFKKNNNFGREISFFQQEMQGQMPNGNGSVFRSFAASGLAEIFEEIDLLTIVPVENPLADPADLRLIGFARKTNSDVVIKCVKRDSPSMGALVEREGRIEIVEYIDLDPAEEYKYSNTGMMAISFPFFLEMKDVDLPLHWVKKKGTMKGEKFIFDVLPFGNVSALCYEKKSCYAPLKTKDSIVSVQEILNEVK
jgi:UDP-N-acetylglucosamine/UDP-N-acetylgalactosamine diphosphorylase